MEGAAGSTLAFTPSGTPLPKALALRPALALAAMNACGTLFLLLGASCFSKLAGQPLLNVLQKVWDWLQGPSGCSFLLPFTHHAYCENPRNSRIAFRKKGENPHSTLVMQGFTARGDEQLPARAFSAWRALIGTAQYCGALQPRLHLLMQPICHAMLNDSRQSVLQVLYLTSCPVSWAIWGRYQATYLIIAPIIGHVRYYQPRVLVPA